MRGTLDCVAIKAPGFGERRKALLEDMAIVTGGTVITNDAGLRLDATELSHLGAARRIVVLKDDSTIVEGRGSDQNIKERVDQLRVQIEESTSGLRPREARGAESGFSWRSSGSESRGCH